MSKDDSDYSIGVVDELAKALSGFEDITPLMQIRNAGNRKQALSDAQEAGMIMSNEDALNALMQVANSYYRDRADSSNMKGAQSFQNGGYGSMSTQDYQQQYGSFIEDDEERANFERLYGTPDVSSFLEDRDRFGADARNELMKLRQQTAGSLFKGDSLASRGIVRDYESRTEQSLADTLRREQEDALGYLADAEANLMDFTQDNPSSPTPPPANTVSVLPTVDQGNVIFNGTEYVWDNQTNRYITLNEYEQGLSEQSDQD